MFDSPSSIATGGIHGKNRKRHCHPELDQTAGWRGDLLILQCIRIAGLVL